MLTGRFLRAGFGMNPRAEQLQQRSHDFFIRVLVLCDDLPRTIAADSIARQLTRAAGSTASNYRAACKARSHKEFIAKISIAAEEADESKGWLEALRDAKLSESGDLIPLIREANELTAIFVASQKTAQRRQNEKDEATAATRSTRRRS